MPTEAEAIALWPTEADTYTIRGDLLIPGATNATEAAKLIQQCYDGGMAGLFKVNEPLTKYAGQDVFVVAFERDIHDDIEVVTPRIVSGNKTLAVATQDQLLDEIEEQSKHSGLGLVVLSLSEPDFYKYEERYAETGGNTLG